MDDLVKRLRALVIMDEVGSDNDLGLKAADRIESQAAEIADLRAQLSRMIDPAKMLRWGAHPMTRDVRNNLLLGNLWVWQVSHMPELAQECPNRLPWQTWVVGEGSFDAGHATESEARAAVERAALEAMGVGK